jgi:hypothetical protein
MSDNNKVYTNYISIFCFYFINTALIYVALEGEGAVRAYLDIRVRDFTLTVINFIILFLSFSIHQMQQVKDTRCISAHTLGFDWLSGF